MEDTNTFKLDAMDASEEIVWFGDNNERMHALTTNWFVMRQLTDRELPSHEAGTTIRPLWDAERLKNEYAASEFIRQNTTIPVPECQISESNGLCYFASKRIVDAVELDSIGEDV